MEIWVTSEGALRVSSLEGQSLGVHLGVGRRTATRRIENAWGM